MKFSLFRYIFSLVLMVSYMNMGIPLVAYAQSIQSASLQKELAELEVSSGGRLGLCATNTANNMSIQYRAKERFPMNCTSKVFGVSAILKKSMTDSALLQKKITYTKQDVDLAEWAPITQKHIKDGMTIFELCAAAIIQSDNAAINLLMNELGGIEIANYFLRAMGDHTSRFDRLWPAEASSIPGDLRDTSTPSAMENSFHTFVLGNILKFPQRAQLQSWLKKSITGYARIRAGVPKGWSVGDKTGTGFYGTSNDIAIIWPPNCSPIILAVYFTQHKKNAVLREEVVASATRLVIKEFAKTDPCIKVSMT